MSSLTIPNTFTNNVSTVDAVTTNANNSAIVAAVNAIDRTNMGTAGIDATSLIPTTNAAATFGGVTAGVGYKFLASATTSVPLTISGVTSQSVDIFDVTLTSGGTKAAWVTSAGALNVGAASTAVSAGALCVSGSTTTGVIGFGASAATLDYGVSTASTFNLSANTRIAGQAFVTGQVIAGGVNNAGSAAGDVILARSATTAIMFWGSSGNYGNIDFGLSNVGGYTFRNAGNTGFAPLFGGAYTNSSDAKYKTNVAPITQALKTLAQLKPSSYNWIHDGQPDFGFLAQEMQVILPQIVRTDNNGEMGIVYSSLTAVNTAAIVELAALFKAYVTAHP